MELDPVQVFSVGLLNAIHGLKNSKVSKHQLAQQAIYVEQEMIGEAVGVQDQISAAFGGINVIRLGPGTKLKICIKTLIFLYGIFTTINLDGFHWLEQRRHCNCCGTQE